jgi:adenylate cyclase
MQFPLFERRLVTVLSADAIAYSRMTAIDEDATHSVLRADRKTIFALIEKYRGRIFSLAGDGLMAEFPDPLSATHCALQIESAIDKINEELPPNLKLRFRLAVNSGDAIVDNDELFGEDINIAARLQEAATGRGVLVSETVRDHVRGKLDVTFEDLGELRFKNIDRLVHVFRTRTPSANENRLPFTEDDQAPFIVSPDTAAPVRGFNGRPALAVLPFENTSQDSKIDYVAEGLAEDLILGLSRLRWLPVIARNSSFLFRGNPINAERIGKLLGARYLLKGSVRLAGNRLRVSAELIDSPNQLSVWASRYDRTLDDIFEVQDDITKNIVAALDVQIETLEQKWSSTKPAEHLNSWDLVRRGMWHQSKLTRSDALQARRLFDEALKNDPGNAEAHIQIAWWIFWDVWVRRASTDELDTMERLARDVLRLDPLDARPHMLLGIAQILRGNVVECRAPLKDALNLNPSLAVAHATIGSSYILDGCPDEAIEPLRTAIRLSPHDLYLFHAAGELGAAYGMLGRWDKAIEWCEKSLRLRPGYWYARVIRIGALARSGQATRARQELSDLFKRRPDFTIEHLRWLPFPNKRWNSFWIRGLQLAGLDTSQDECTGEPEPPR